MADYTTMRNDFIRQGMAARAKKAKAPKTFPPTKHPNLHTGRSEGHGTGDTDNRSNTDNRGMGD